MAAWFLAVVTLLVGGVIGTAALGAALCEDVGSPGSDGFCNVGLALRRRRLFWTAVGGPVLLAALNFALASIYGRG